MSYPRRETKTQLDGYSDRRTKSVFAVAVFSLIIIYSTAAAIGQTGVLDVRQDQVKDSVPMESSVGDVSAINGQAVDAKQEESNILQPAVAAMPTPTSLKVSSLGRSATVSGPGGH